MTRTPGRRRLAYILAPSHSGTTLLAMLLAAHPQVCTAGELKLSAIDDPATYPCSCGTLLRACGFWKRITTRMGARGLPFDVLQANTDFLDVRGPARRLLEPLHRGPWLERWRDMGLALMPSWRTRYAVRQIRNAALVDCLAAECGADVVVDSSKVGIRLKFLLRNPHLDVKVVRLIRDGRAVAVTYMDPAEFADARDPKMRGGGMGGARWNERLPIDEAAREWRRSHEEAEAIVRTLPREQWMQVHYEKLCEDPNATLGSVFRFLGVDSNRPRPEFRGVDHHIVGNGMRLDRSSAVSVDQRWMTVWTDRERIAFDAVAGTLNRAYGYTS